MGCLCACLPTLLPLWKLVKGQNPQTVAVNPSSPRSSKRRQDSETHFFQEKDHERSGTRLGTASCGADSPDYPNGEYQIQIVRATTVESNGTTGGVVSFDDDIDLTYPPHTHKASVTSTV